MRFELQHPADQLVMIMERIYGYGMTTTSGGNLSIKDENGDIWITPGGIDKGSLTDKDIVRVLPDGTFVGKHKPSIELPFHQAVYAARPDIRAVLHAHPPALISFSIVRKLPQTRLLPNISMVCGEIGMAEYGLPGSKDLGKKVSGALESGINAVILENHGVVVVGRDLFEAFMAFETLDFCARIEIEASILGKPVALTDRQLEVAKSKQHSGMGEFVPKSFSSAERAARKEMCGLIHRAYDQKLFTSTQGTFSTKLGDDSFLITPYMVDRKYMDVDDLVRIDGGLKEAGKMPSRSVMLHKYIYEKQKHVNSVIIAHPPHIMAFAVTKEIFDTRIIPESYVMLRDIKKLPFGASFTEPAMVAGLLKKDNPLVMVENDCLIVTGASLLNAFDRLEVAEYSAKALISAKSIGELAIIDREKVAALEDAFKLD